MYRCLSIFLVLFLPANIYAGNKQRALQAYTENLAAYRTKFNNPINTDHNDYGIQKLKYKKNYDFSYEYDITLQLHELLVDLKTFHEMTEVIYGYTIQAYTGANRQMAFQIKDKLCSLYPHLHVEIQYKQPNFSVRVGRFLERLESYQLYISIKKDFPQAIIRSAEFPNKVDVFAPLEQECRADTMQNLDNKQEELIEKGNTENVSLGILQKLKNDVQ
ncbi:MAG: hypothetical protein ACYC2U_01905 [Candidatus Amoebophilus sp.]